MNDQRAQWRSRLGFVLAAAGSAIGLGNIWKFPYITGENGGGLFVLIYLVCIALVGIPIMMAEIMIGRAAQRQPVAAFHVLQGKRTPWAAVGWLGVLSGFIILSYYSVVAGWAMDYTLKSVVNFTGPIHAAAEQQAARYVVATSIDQMRQRLIQRRAERQVRGEVARIRARARPSTWRAFEQYQAAMAWLEEANSQAATDGSGHGQVDLDAAARRLQADPVLRARIQTAKQLHNQIEQAKQRALRQAGEHYAGYSDEQIAIEAAAVERRQVTFEKIDQAFGALASDGWTCTLWAALFTLITILIVAGGISSGIERTCRILMPTLFILILIMVVYGMTKPGFGDAVAFVFKPDPTKLKASGVLEALGHAFFTLSLGMGAMITYGSYQQTKTGLANQSVMIALLDTLIALLACLMIFPIIFSYDQEPAAGPGLVFKSMPLAFAEIGRGGMLLAIIFFGLVVFAALTSAISLLEVVASYFIDELQWPRRRAAWLLGGAIFLFGVPTAFSSDPQFVMTGWKASYGTDFFTTMDYLASNWMLPLGGLLISLYAGWVMPRRLQEIEAEGLAPALFQGWLVLVRFIAPALVVVVLLQKVGILDADEFFHGLF